MRRTLARFHAFAVRNTLEDLVERRMLGNRAQLAKQELGEAHSGPGCAATEDGMKPVGDVADLHHLGHAPSMMHMHFACQAAQSGNAIACGSSVATPSPAA